ncbi:hypothetical protein PUN28_000487 [Cardiocondyla obscurior]|uniref:Uncharacterized protein n=3 Tax=Cardiocondyla obscurior TaxID=286306 RepID=A0AAW2H055_9HYME
MCICISEAKNKIRRPPPNPLYAPTLILNKPRPINQRISMGNTIHIGGRLPHQRIPYNHANYRIRRPMYNAVLPTGWKNQIPMRAASLNNRPPVLPLRVPTKEFYSVNKIPEYSPEYRPELVALPSTHRGGVDDDKGPIHTIPAPNLSPADKPLIRYGAGANLENVVEPPQSYSTDLHYHLAQNPRRTTFGPDAINNGLSPKRVTTNSIPSQRNQYEVTESNDVTLKERETAQPVVFPPQDLDMTKLYSIIINNPQPQPNELFVNRPVNLDPNVQLGQSNVPMQTNLHSSLNVGFPPTVISQTPYTVMRQDLPVDLHVGHPAPAGPPLSALELYNLLNNLPHNLAEQYRTDQQHILQHQQPQPQLDPILESNSASFSQPQMHSFNYDEQTNQLQLRQQQILSDRNYATESVAADYNLNSESPSDIRKEINDNVHSDQQVQYPINVLEQSENNLDEYGEIARQNNPAAYFDKVMNDNGISTRYYTTLPNREAAEKLAALAAAGNVNSRLIGQLQKQQKKDKENDETMPFNHKNDDGNDTIIQHNQTIRLQTDDNQQQKYNQTKSDQNMNINFHSHHRQSYSVENDEKSPLQITVPDENDYVTSDEDPNNVKDDIGEIEYEYENENENEDVEPIQTTLHYNDSRIEFGSRLRS